jgi:hypothetical protein
MEDIFKMPGCGMRLSFVSIIASNASSPLRGDRLCILQFANSQTTAVECLAVGLHAKCTTNIDASYNSTHFVKLRHIGIVAWP